MERLFERQKKRTKVIGVKIDDADAFRLYREQGSMPLMRGIAWVKTIGLPTCGREASPRDFRLIPVKKYRLHYFVEVCKGEAQIETVLQDVPSSHKTELQFMQIC